MDQLTQYTPNKILIRSTNWIGDAIMTTPAVRTIRQNFPKAHITLLVHPWVSGVFSASPHIDAIIFYHKKKEHKGVLGLWRLGRELAQHHFDMAILLQNAFEAAFLTRLANVPIRAGYKRDCRGPLLTHGISIDPKIRKVHQVHYYQDMVRQLGLHSGSDELFLRISETDTSWAQERISALNVEGPLVGLNPGAAYGPAKRWPAERYGELANRLVKSHNASIVVFGTDADSEAATIIEKKCGKPIMNLCGATTLEQAMAMINECDCFVTNDSGLMHVAAALKTPLVAIFGSTDHIATGPFSKNSVIVRKEIACSPCLKPDCKKEFECMMNIEVSDVLSGLNQFLS